VKVPAAIAAIESQPVLVSSGTVGKAESLRFILLNKSECFFIFYEGKLNKRFSEITD
jgi:hypothetical protein